MAQKKQVEDSEVTTQTLTPELTESELDFYEATAAQLAKKYAVSKVHPVVYIDKDTLKRTVCYLKEPNYLTKIRVLDKAATLGVYTASDELRVACTLKEESDPITYGDSSECDKYKLGVTDFAGTMVVKLQNQFKKK